MARSPAARFVWTAGSAGRAVRRAGDCNFTADERNLAFDELVAWLEQGVHPDGEDVLTPDVADLGVHWIKTSSVTVASAFRGPRVSAAVQSWHLR
jgi:hypothetical protein